MIFRMFILAMLAQVVAVAADGEARFLSNTRQLIYEGKRSGEGYFSADGKSLVFQSEREADNPFYQIYVLDLESGDIRRVSPGTGKTTCAFLRPGSDDVLFASTHQDAEAKAKQKAEIDFRASGKTRRYSWDYDENFDIFTAKRDGSGLKRLTNARGYDAEGSYSPDGTKIAFCSVRDAYPLEKLPPKERQRAELDISYFGEIYIMNADGSGQKRLTSTPGYDGGPFFSPDGQRIIWRRFNEEGTIADIYTMKLDGRDVRRLTDFGAMSWAPYFHPSGKYVIFASNKHGFGNFELFMVDAEGAREPVRVTTTDGFDGLPVFSPDGRKLCWTSNRTSDNKSQLFLADWNHEAALEALQQAAGRVASATLSSSSASPATSQLTSTITTNDLHAHVSFLAADSLEGRLTGTKGAQQAAEYIAQQLKSAGLQPLGKDGTFLQPFEFTSGVKVVTNKNRLSLATHGENVEFEVEKDFRPLSFTANGEVEGDVVFAGYGLTVPGKMGEGYDSYAGLNVSNKIVMVLRYVPEGVDQKRRQELNRYAGLRYKALIARTHGARALLIVTGPNSPNPGTLAPLTFDTSLAGSGIVAASISADVANTLLIGSGKTLKELQTALDIENPHAQHGLPLPGMRLKVATAVQHIKKTDHNVVALLPAGSGSSEYVMLGAHYDHLGHGETGGFAIKGEEGQVHNGADDNASGVAAMLEIAAALAEERKQRPADFPRGIIFSFWSGEELGLIGSSHFAEHPVVNLSNVVAYLNFDMVGRLRDNKLTLQGVGSSALWKKLVEKRNVAAGFTLTLQDDPYLPTDTTAFYPKGIPVLAFFTGSHENYHRPGDDTDTLNYDGAERIAKFARALTLDLVKGGERPDYVKVERSSTGGGGRDALRAYLGTIPDYATDVQGVKLSGARGGSPADKAGIKGGDVIVEFAGQKIANIYDYTYALDAVKIGVPVKVIVLREGKRVELNVTPDARK
ncbi:MAG: M20/M25/M40 family metallo-hydrolase [Verrucomicrobiota bacterium]